MRAALVFVICFFSLGGIAQVYVQLEIFNDPKAIKYQVNDKITYRAKYDPGVWNKGRIKEILVDENTLVLNNEILKLEDVTDFMLYRNSVNYTARLLQAFGVSWLVQGSIAAAFGRNTTWSSVLTISSTSYVSGWLFRKLFYKIPVRLNDKNRLRIIDTRFTIPEKS